MAFPGTLPVEHESYAVRTPRSPATDTHAAPILGSANGFKIALFSINIGGAPVMSDAEGWAKAARSESVHFARTAERDGFEPVLPLGRRRGTAAVPTRRSGRSRPFT